MLNKQLNLNKQDRKVNHPETCEAGAAQQVSASRGKAVKTVKGKLRSQRLKPATGRHLVTLDRKNSLSSQWLWGVKQFTIKQHFHCPLLLQQILSKTRRACI